jgi:hypothetical protein
MRKRIHGKQSIPAIILYSPVRAMKHLTTAPAIIPMISRFSRSRATYSRNRTGYSRTLYTSIAPEQSNIIFK